MTIKKLQTGDRLPGIPKDAWNAFVEQTKNARKHPKAGARLVPPDAGIIQVRNDSGAARAQYAILGLDGPVITPTDNENEFKRPGGITFKVITPTTASHANKFCILLDPLTHHATEANRPIGRAVIAGVVQVRLTGADVGFASVTNSDATKLTADAAGPVQVLYAEAGSSERWALVRLGNSASGGSSLSWAYVWDSDVFSVPSINNATPTFIDWADELEDTDGYWSGGNPSRLTVPSDGLYRFEATVSWASSAVGVRFITISTDSGLILGVDGTPAHPTSGVTQSLSVTYEMEAGDYAQVSGYQNSGGALNLVPGGHTHHFAVYRDG